MGLEIEESTNLFPRREISRRDEHPSSHPPPKKFVQMKGELFFFFRPQRRGISRHARPQHAIGKPFSRAFFTAQEPLDEIDMPRREIGRRDDHPSSPSKKIRPGERRTIFFFRPQLRGISRHARSQHAIGKLVSRAFFTAQEPWDEIDMPRREISRRDDLHSDLFLRGRGGRGVAICSIGEQDAG